VPSGVAAMARERVMVEGCAKLLSRIDTDATGAVSPKRGSADLETVRLDWSGLVMNCLKVLVWEDWIMPRRS